MWHRIMEKFSTLGYFCMAPDMRGYSPDACPKGTGNYKLRHLGNDVMHLADSAGKDRFHLVGHDWGALIGWYLAFRHGDRIETWSALSVPHNRAMIKAIITDDTQRKKSRYVRWFQIPVLPELMIRKNDFEKFRKLWKHSPPEEVEDYLSVFRRKKSLTAALNYYRANIRKGRFEHVGDIEVPTLFIWGRNDLAIGEVAATGCGKYVKGPFTYLPLDGGHWLIQSNYADVEAAIIAHITR
jgi:pimeloyl-ACP methyl ester carboxylesterase